MLTELLIFSVLVDEESTIYKIKKKIDKYFFLFYSASLGSIHPAIKKMHSNKYLNLKNLMSQGGQKSSIYSITKEGKKYFEELMLQDLPENPASADQIIKIKTLLLPKLEKDLKKQVVSILKDYHQNRLLDFENFQENIKVYKNLELKRLNLNYIKFSINKLNEEINWLNMQEFI